MAEAVVSIVVGTLADFIIQEAKHFCRVRDQVELAQTELQMMQGFLKDADKRQQDDETVRIWVAKVRDAAYDMEDAIEIFSFKVSSKTRRLACILIKGKGVHKIVAEIEKITTRISSLRLSLQTYNIREIRESRDGATSSYQRQQQLRRTYSHIIERDVVGLQDNIKELVTHLVNDENCHKVVSIWGMGGLGKTTLAKQVYYQSEVRRHFSCFAWVCISHRFQVREVWEGILIKLISATNEQREEIGRMREDEIAKKLYLILQERTCLVVLDDIWSIETWDSLKAGFPHEKTMSKILLTTRNKAVALHADRKGFLHQPRPLNDSESWQLFEIIAIFGREETNPEIHSKMKELGKKMLLHCAGLPLAISALAGLLARKDTIDEWNAVHKNVFAYIRRGKGHEQEYAGASWVLALSYDDLPYHLKPCFLYLGHFPEDFEIPVKLLTQLWMAEGLISLGQQGQSFIGSLEDIGYSYLSELVERCVVQIGERGSIRKIKTCRIHDLMRDLCLLKTEEENFLQIVNFSHKKEAMYPSASSTVSISKVRRLAIHLDDKADRLVPPRDERNGHLRSLLYFTPRNWMPRNQRLVQSVFKVFKLLRVLRFENMCTEVELPSDIGNMVHLRFLSLRRCHIKRLPLSMGNLKSMQTLDLRFRQLDIVPNVLWKMEQLRHLYLPLYYRASGKLRLDTLHYLQTLLHVDNSHLNDITELTNLKKLAVQVSSPLKNLEKVLTSTSSTLERIRSLYVHNVVGIHSYAEVSQIVSKCHNIYKLDLNGPTVELPKDLQGYPNLTKLWLCRCFLKENQMSVLEKLPNLRNLYLQSGTFEDNVKTLVCSKGGFLHLEFLSLSYMDEIDGWTVEEGAMPSLCQLHISRCRGLTTFPDGLRYNSSLKKLSITRMPRTFYSKLQEGGEDFYKIQHVPSLVFGEACD
ncbi:putative P-loop containing nucleoside triphosphate hydrolase, leucine-rich repeat domain, L [Rosa chinensis]|uniref:Putative P-loop containing nucleoside triphosphate hydrolase, leucine-rich repeat domain, L n=1 Tax=Rosa chinensis TaxID=74649 RepID=A0A2P6QUM9_ROSCH|nr:putative disease resistance protein At1g50180 [Rosa chinensis]XP_024194429.1 putative disease resistance protein At1g50180 [Rosa chinensis]PRQ37890.1 putative P-loop containing nucleoside triphosphate hydrolase, leucine-rich repeat domain, L [Rosa chinensis]